MNPTQLFDFIESSGGNITATPDRRLICTNISPDLRSEVERLQYVITSILLGECEQVPVEAPSKPREVSQSKRKKRITCEVCVSGKGCRTRSVHPPVLCPICAHWCKSHHAEYAVAPYGVISAAGCHWPQGKCSCPGFPQKEKKTKQPKSDQLSFPEDHHEHISA